MSKGQNHLDCAELYGGFYTDEVVGRAIAGRPREDLFIADKLWKSSVGKGLVRPAVAQMLTKLGTDYIDLLYIHAPWPEIDWKESIPQIDELIDEGTVRYLGVSNFTVDQMQTTMQIARHPVAANQMNFNVLYKDEVPETFRHFCKEHAIQLIAYQPIKRQEVLENKRVNAIASAHHATPAQVALAWLMQVGALPIPKATNTVHIDENLAAINVKLTDAAVKSLEML
jgi:2,5-diketo-D-gluconate reductase B